MTKYPLLSFRWGRVGWTEKNSQIKHPISEISPLPSGKRGNFLGDWNFVDWILFGIWDLVIGIYDLRAPVRAIHELPLQPEISLTQDLVLKQLITRTFSDNFSRGKDIVAGGHFEDRAHVLFNEQDGDP